MDFLKKNLIPSIIEVVITNPIEVWKIRRQSQLPFHIKYSYRGFIPRALGFIPMRTTFWYLYFSSNKHKLHPIFSSFLITTGTTIIDYPIDLIKTKRIINISHKPNYVPMLCYHYSRNLIFTSSIVYTNYLNHKFYHLHPIYNILIGSFIGATISHPFDVWKIKMFLAQKSGPISFKGYPQRLLITTLGITTGSFIINCLYPQLDLMMSTI
jgi:hypothetical protein